MSLKRSTVMHSIYFVEMNVWKIYCTWIYNNVYNNMRTLNGITSQLMTAEDA